MTKFSLEKNLIERLNMTANAEEMLSVTIYFKKEFLYDFINQFGSSQKYESIPNISPTEEMDFQAVIKVPDNNETYRWFMQHADNVKVIGSRKVRINLKQRFEKALKAFENLKDDKAA